MLDFANIKALDPRITFTRASTATYYDSNTVAKAEENLLLYSEQVDLWGAPLGGTVSANTTTAPNGASTADTFVATAGAGLHRIGQNAGTLGTTRTFSIYAKVSTHNFIQVYWGSDSTAYANFNISTGAVGTVGAAATASIVSVGSGWYRCIVTTTSGTADTGVNLILISSATAARAESWTTAGTEAVFLWGGQLEQRSSVTAYTPTTTAPITNYIPVLQTAAAGVARFDHNPITRESLGLLIEEQRTNLMTYSQELDNAAWTKQTNVTISANSTVAPDGTITADTVTTSGISPNLLYPTLATGANSTTYTASVYAKAGTATTFRFGLTINSEIATGYYDFDLSAATATNATSGFTSMSASITAVGGGWYRCTVTGTTPASGVTLIGLLYRSFVAGSVFIWGAQVEAGAFATSYIPTAASQVTRNADAASMTGSNFSSWYRADEGTIFLDFTPFAVSSDSRFLEIGDASATNRLLFYGNAPFYYFQTRISSVDEASVSFSTAFVAGAASKQAGAYKVNDIAFDVNGATVSSDTSSRVPRVTEMRIGSSFGGTFANSHFRRVAYYPARLTNAQLQAITTQ